MKKMKENKTLEYYLGQDYPITVYKAEEGGYVAEIEDLPGCITEGESIEEVTQRLEVAKKAWLEVAYEDNIEIPIPRTKREYSGKFIVRIPRYVHQRLAELAMGEGVSLNQIIESILSAGISVSKQNEKINEIIQKLEHIEKEVTTDIPRVFVPYQWELERIEPMFPALHKKELKEHTLMHENMSEGVIAA